MRGLQQWAKGVRRDILTVWIAARDPRVPLGVKLLAALVAAYALSPVDLIPDFIPVLGHLDDLVIVPAGIVLVLSLMPADVLVECRAAADQMAERPTSHAALAAMIVIWLAAGALMIWLVWSNSGY